MFDHYKMSIECQAMTMTFQGHVFKWLYPWKNGSIVTKRKTNISIKYYALNVAIDFDLGHDLDLDFSRSNIQFALSQQKWMDCHEM